MIDVDKHETVERPAAQGRMASIKDERLKLTGKNYARWILAIGLMAGPLLALGQAVDPATRKLAGANGLLARQQFDAARQEFNEYLQTYPTNADAGMARFGLALSFYQAGNFVGAIDPLTVLAADKKFTRREDALAMLGHCYEALGQFDKALVPINLLLTDYPKGTQAQTGWINRSQNLYRLGNFKDALAIAQAFPKVYPDSGNIATAIYLEALCQHALGQNEAAISALHRFIRAYPNHPQVFDATLLEGQCLESLGNLKDALAVYEKMAADAPVAAKPAAYYAIGMACQQAGRYPAAADTFALIVRDYPHSAYAGMAQLQAAIVQLRSGDTAGARNALTDIKQQDPGRTATATYWLARCDMADKKYAEARTQLAQLLIAAPAIEEKPDILFDIASCDLAQHLYPQAVEGFAHFRDAYPQHRLMPDSLYQQALALHDMGKFKESQALCDQLHGLNVRTLLRPQALLGADNLFLLGQYQPAAAALATLAEDTAAPAAERHHIAIRRGQCAYYLGDYATAITLLKPIAVDVSAAANPLLPDAVFLLGDAQLQTGRFAEAAETLNHYLTLAQSERKQEATYKLAVAQRQGGDEKAALETLSTLVNGPADSAWVQRAWLESGQLAYQNKKYGDAATAFGKVLAAQPAADIGAPAQYALARIEMEAGRYGDAAKKFADVAQKYPQHELAADALFSQGAALKEAGQWQQALTVLENYLEHDADGKFANDARQISAVCMAKLGKAQKGIQQLTELASHAATRNDGVLYDLAWAQRGAGDNKAALETYRNLLHDYPNSNRTAAVQVEAAELLYQDGQFTPALELLRNVVVQQDAASRARIIAEYRMGLCYAGLNQQADAAAAFDTFVVQHAADGLAPAALYQSALAWIQLGKLDVGQKRLASIMTNYPTDVNASLATLKVGELQNQNGDYPTAKNTFQAWLKDHPKDSLSPLAWFGIGWSQENQAQYEPARQAYTKVVDNDTSATAARAQFQIGETWFAQKKYDQAARELLKVDILYAYPEWSARALFEAGRCFEQLKQNDEAKKQYALCVKKFKETDVAALAKKRLEALDAQ